MTDDLEQFEGEAKKALEHGDIARAECALSKATGRFPLSPDAHGALGRLLLELGRTGEALGPLRKAVELAPSRHDLHNDLGVALFREQQMDDAEAAFRGALEVAPDSLGPILNLVQLYRVEERFVEAVDLVQRALALNPYDPDVLLAFGMVSLDLDELEGAEAALQLLSSSSPSSPRTARLRRLISERHRSGPMARTQMFEHRPCTTSVPANIQRRQWGDDEVAIACGRSPAPWSPRHLATGIGGSEEAVIHLSRALTALGWHVTVYCEVSDQAGVYDGVLYRPFDEFNEADRFNILVGWRNVALFDTTFDAKRSYLWLHDLPNPNRYIRRRLDNISRIFVLSHFHRTTLPGIPDGKFLVTSNGIDVAQIECLEKAAGPRDPSRCIYASSYVRGLEHLLTVWGGVREAVSEASLHLYYGWENFDKMHAANPERMAWKARMERLMRQPGIYEHGRVGQEQILLETLRSGLWTYPTDFEEISCITAMKCQAAGAVPVVFDYAALQETVQFGIKVPVEKRAAHLPPALGAFQSALITALRNGSWQDSVRSNMTPWARARFGWDEVARQWDKEFKRNGR